MSNPLTKALNEAAPPADAVTASAEPLAVALQAEGKTPEWIELLPAGPVIVGRDGRRFTAADPAEIVTVTQSAIGLPLVLDFEHASERPELAANAGAAGWIEGLEVRDGSIWGQVAWTRRGANAVAEREYRFISPVFNHTRDADQRIVALVSAGLVHRPNLSLKALNRREDRMDLKALLKKLGLPETTSEADALTAVGALQTKANSAAAPDLARYVPKDQHDATVTALNAAQTELATLKSSGSQARAETLVEDAVKAGKITPASKTDYLGFALNSFDAAKAMIDKLPVIVAGGESDAARRAAEAAGKGGESGSLTPQQKAICSSLGLSEADYAKSLKSED